MNPRREVVPLDCEGVPWDQENNVRSLTPIDSPVVEIAHLQTNIRMAERRLEHLKEEEMFWRHRLSNLRAQMHVLEANRGA